MTNRVRVTALGHEIIDASEPPISTVPTLNDLRKARWYLDREIAKREADQS